MKTTLTKAERCKRKGGRPVYGRRYAKGAALTGKKSGKQVYRKGKLVHKRVASRGKLRCRPGGYSTVAELKQFAKDHGLHGYSGLNKAQLLRLIGKK